MLDIPQELYNSILTSALKDKEIYSNITSQGGIIKFVSNLTHGSDLEAHTNEEVAILKDANKVLESKLNDKDGEIKVLLEKYNTLLASTKKATGSNSIADLEKEYECMTDIHGYISGPVKIPENIPGEYKVDEETSKRISANLGIVDKPSDTFPIKSTQSEGYFQTETRVVNGILQVAAYFDTMINGRVVTRKIIQDWNNVSLDNDDISIVK
jgi:hypothetical protein